MLTRTQNIDATTFTPSWREADRQRIINETETFKKAGGNVSIIPSGMMPIKTTTELQREKASNRTSKPMLQLTKYSGTLVKEFRSIAHAARETRTHTESIKNVALGTGPHKTAGGYVWKFKNSKDAQECRRQNREKDKKTNY